MNSYIDLVQKTNGQFTAQLYELQLSDKLKTDMDKPFCKPFNLYELSVADQLMSFDDVRRIFAMYEKTLRLKDNLIANLLEKCRLLEQENQEWQQQAQRVPLLEEHIKFLEEHPTITNIYNAPHYQADKIEKHTDIEVGSQSISNGGVGINYSKPTPTTMPSTPDAHANKTATEPESYSTPNANYTPLTFDQRIQRESIPVQVFYEKVSPIGFFSMPVITCLTDQSKIQLLCELIKPNNTPFAVAMIYHLKFYEHCLGLFEGYSKNSFYNLITAALNHTVSSETVKKNFISIYNPTSASRDKYTAWNLLSEVQDFYNQLEKIEKI